MDQDQLALEGIPNQLNGVTIRKIRADLNDETSQPPCADCILMANVLHFIPEQEKLLKRLRGASARFLIVEYEQGQRSKWRPYPVSFLKLRKLFHAAGVDSVTQISTRKSRFGGIMYAALAEAATSTCSL